MSINSNAKGKRGELAAVNYLKQWFPDAKRTQQYNGLGRGDVECPDSLPNVHIEVKYGYDRKVMDVCLKTLRDAMAQAERDCDGKEPCVLWKPKGLRVWRLTYYAGAVMITVAGDRDIKWSLDSLND